jgi:hypothetical protein
VVGLFTRSLSFGTVARTAMISVLSSDGFPVVIFSVVNRLLGTWTFWYVVLAWHFVQWLRSPGYKISFPRMRTPVGSPSGVRLRMSTNSLTRISPAWIPWISSLKLLATSGYCRGSLP